LVKDLTIGAQRVTLQIWDTAGQERFRSMAPLYYRGAAAAILVFSLTDASSFEKLKEWVRELTSNVEEPLVLAIAANKCDLAERAVPAEALEKYAESIGALLFETSAKSSLGVRFGPSRVVDVRPRKQLPTWLGLYKILFDFEAFVHESFILSLPPPTCIARTIAMLLHVYCAIYDAPPTPLLYAIHHTILVMAISCKGQHLAHAAQRAQLVALHTLIINALPPPPYPGNQRPPFPTPYP